MKRNQRYGGTSRQSPSPGAVSNRSGAWVLGGPLIASFDGGDVRLTPEDLIVYGDDERREIPVPTDTDGRPGIVSQFYDAVVNHSQMVADGQWGKATLEVLLAVRQSGQERRGIFLSHQMASRN